MNPEGQAAGLDEYAAELVANWPELDGDQLSRLCLLLRPFAYPAAETDAA